MNGFGRDLESSSPSYHVTGELNGEEVVLGSFLCYDIENAVKKLYKQGFRKLSYFCSIGETAFDGKSFFHRVPMPHSWEDPSV